MINNIFPTILTLIFLGFFFVLLAEVSPFAKVSPLKKRGL